MTIRQDAFTKDLGDDFVALDSRGHGVARASSLDALKAAAPGATSYFNASQLDKALNDEKSGRRKREEAPPTGQPEPVNQTKSGQESLSPFDHDGDGKHGGSPKGENSTAARGRAARQRKPAK